jgi:hypothetical protein
VYDVLVNIDYWHALDRASLATSTAGRSPLRLGDLCTWLLNGSIGIFVRSSRRHPRVQEQVVSTT